jgi:hypothetical protein
MSELRTRGVQVIERPYEQTTLQNLAPDVTLPEGIGYCHRQDSNVDIYFLTNQTATVQTMTPEFRNKQATAVRYNPVANTAEPFNGTLTLQPYESAFVLFGQMPYLDGIHLQYSAQQATEYIEEPLAPHTWDIAFKESGVSLSGQQLFDWSRHQDPRVQYFSGHARYTTAVKISNKKMLKGRVWLTLPEVKDIAHVWVNGRDCGTAWTAPYEVEITGALQKGKNLIEIEVVNTWHNALRGWDQGKAPYKGIWTNARYRTKGEGLLPAGLLNTPKIITTTN